MRFWEIDSLRGIAIAMMILFHSMFDLYFFKKLDIDVQSGFWWLFARSTAAIFIFLVGVSLTISYSKSITAAGTKSLFRKYLMRGLKIFSWGLAVTFITWLFLKQGFVILGILHFIGISIMLAYPFLSSKRLMQKEACLLFGVFCIAVGLYLHRFSVDTYYLMWLGIIPKTLYTVDYFPLLPWFGVVLAGMYFGKLIYKDNKRMIDLPDLSNILLIRFLCFLGRNSLFIYLVHQPILIGLIYLL